MKVIDRFTGKYYFLSNFYTCLMEYDGIQYCNSEAAFQAQKCQNRATRIKKYSTLNPSLAKKEGRKDKLPDNWDIRTTEIMHDVLMAKFSDEKLKKMLLETGDALLVEGNNWHDNNWGDCSCPKCKGIEGQNRLGKMLMQVRDELREAS